MSLGTGRNGMLRLATFVAALAFVLQSALAIAAPPVQRDIFGNVICANGSGQMPAGGQGSGHMTDCCLLSCNMASPLAAGLPDAISVPGSVAVVGSTVYSAHAVIEPHGRRTPANPRAPPRFT